LGVAVGAENGGEASVWAKGRDTSSAIVSSNCCNAKRVLHDCRIDDELPQCFNFLQGFWSVKVRTSLLPVSVFCPSSLFPISFSDNHKPRFVPVYYLRKVKTEGKQLTYQIVPRKPQAILQKDLFLCQVNKQAFHLDDNNCFTFPLPTDSIQVEVEVTIILPGRKIPISGSPQTEFVDLSVP
jgi:hypothetical protein